MPENDRKLPTHESASAGQVDEFLAKVARAPARRSAGRKGRLLFAMDATASRQPTWDKAVGLQGEMFKVAGELGGIDVQLVFYRGFGEFKASPWLSEPEQLARMMSSVLCLAGTTQIRKVLRHAVNQARGGGVNAVVFVGDCMEEDVDALGAVAGELGLLGVPVFLFHEGDDPAAAFAFGQIARLSGGACCRFDAASPRMLRDLLGAVAAYAAGGRAALEDLARRQGGEVLRIADQMAGRREG